MPMHSSSARNAFATCLQAPVARNRQAPRTSFPELGEHRAHALVNQFAPMFLVRDSRVVLRMEPMPADA